MHMVDYVFQDVGRLNCASEDVSFDFYNKRESFPEITEQILTTNGLF